MSESEGSRGEESEKGCSGFIGDRDRDRSSWGGVGVKFRVVGLRINVS